MPICFVCSAMLFPQVLIHLIYFVAVFIKKKQAFYKEMSYFIVFSEGNGAMPDY
jgi:hypothetical protein